MTAKRTPLSGTFISSRPSKTVGFWHLQSSTFLALRAMIWTAKRTS